MGKRARALIATLTVVAVPAITVRLLHGIADRPWFQIEYRDFLGWLGRTALTDALTAFARLAALVLAYYLLISTVVYLVALVSGSRRFIRITRPFAIPVVRSLADRVIAGTIAVGALAAPLVASSPPTLGAAAGPAVTVQVIADYIPESRLVQATDPSVPGVLRGEVSFSGRPVTPPPEAATPARDTPLGPVEVVTGPGDHLWGMAETAMTNVLGRAPMDHEVAPYWREVVDVNRDRIRSGNPNLIQPGEVIRLPDPTPFTPSG